MKKLYFLALSLLLFSKGYSQTIFTPGNLVVYKVGNGIDTLSSAAFPVSLDEFTTTGSFVNAHPMPTTIVGSNKRITASGSATSEGQMTRSANKKYIILTGYDTIPGPTKLKVASSLAINVNRMVGVIGADGVVDATTALTDAYSGNNIRGAASSNGTDIWISGTGTNPGVRYLIKGSTTSTEISTSVTNIRTVNIFNGQLYSTSASGAFQGVCSDGTGLPVTSGQTIKLLTGFPTASGPSPYAFSINPASTIAYVADDRAVASGGGVQKWALNGATWSLAYTLNTGLATGPRGLVVDWNGGNAIIYAVTGESKSNSIVTVADAGSSSAFSTLATAATNYVYRSITFAPQDSVVPVTLISFKAASVASGIQLQWATSNEINTKSFEIVKSNDGIHFLSLAEIISAGNSQGTVNYQTIDKTPSAGINYYRLKTIDADGKFTYSNIVKIKYAAASISIYPNPAKDQITINHPVSVNAALIIIDMQGRKIKTLSINPGNTINKIVLNELTKGQYILKYIDNGYTSIHILTKQ